MELRHYIRILGRRALLIAVATIVAALYGYQASDSADRYAARSTVYVGANRFDFGTGAAVDRQSEVQRIAYTYSVMIDSAPIAALAIENAGVARSASQVVASTTTGLVPATNLIQVVVVDEDPRVAQALANGLADAFVAEAEQFDPTSARVEGTLPSSPAYVFERARLPTRPQPTETVRDTIRAGLFALVLTAGSVLVVDYLDDTITDAGDAESKLGLPVLGVVPVAHGDLRLDDVSGRA